MTFVRNISLAFTFNFRDYSLDANHMTKVRISNT